MNRSEAEQVAAAIAIIRPDWLRTSMLTILGRHQHRPARDAMLALVWIAYDPDTKTPARIDSDGPWWHTARLAGVAAEPTQTPPTYLACPMHGKPEPCTDCPPPADPKSVAQAVAAARAAIRTTPTKGQQ